MSHLMTCAGGDAPNATWTDLAMPTLASVNCAKHEEDRMDQIRLLRMHIMVRYDCSLCLARYLYSIHKSDALVLF